jgi:NAD(P)-dependent dehydrogenase (short-subunit alcohol dehydrogenase family)
MSNRLQGKVAVITGAVSGMGLAACELFVAEGAKVVVADVQEAKGIALERRLGDSVSFIRCDVRSEDDVRAAVARAVTRFGGLDVMYHNAATTGDVSGIEDMSVEGWDDTQAMLLRANMLCIKHAVPAMKQRGGGSVILVSSAAPVALGGSGPFAYTVGKAGVIAMGRFAALQLGQHFIRVNVLVPGGFATSIWSGHVHGDAGLGDQISQNMNMDHFAKMQHIPRAGRVSDIAEAAVFLASDASSFITGVTLPVDGGLTLHRKWEATAEGQLAAVRQSQAGLKT